MRYISVFSGVEAASLAWEPLGWEPVCFCEVDEFPSAVLSYRWPGVPNLGDITKVRWSDVINQWGPADLVVGGSPCQSFSIAGGRTGLEGASGLMWEYVRCVREIKPDWILWENVPGALSSSHGEDFRCLLESLDALGYGLAWRVLDAQFFGVAQRRERVFLVGRLGDPDGPCKVLFEPESLRWDTPTSREKRAELAARAGGGAQVAGGALNPEDPQSKRVFDTNGPAPTLSSGTGEGMNIQPSVLCAGFKYHQGAGAGNIGYEPDQSPTLTADYHNPAIMCMTDTQPHAMVDGEVCGALSATMQKDPPVIAKTLFEPVSFAANQRGELRLQGGDGTVVGAVPASQSGKQVQGVLCQYGDVAGALTARGDSSPCADRGPSVVSDGYVVRRLTPRECERLQGMPDDHTKVPYRGKTAEECPDTPRYKAIGNSMAVPVMRWLGERIAMADASTCPRG